jgi:hypothetical protein
VVGWGAAPEEEEWAAEVAAARASPNASRS